MKKYVKRLKTEQGFTLIELIAAITLFSMVVGIISMVTMFGFRSYHKITIENSLRDEADIIMSTIINELYTFAPEKVTNTTNINGITLKKSSTADEVISFSQGQLVIGSITDEPNPNDPRTAIHSNLSGSVISSTSADGRLCQTTLPCDTGLIKIKLQLAQEYDGRPYTMELESKFGF